MFRPNPQRRLMSGSHSNYGASTSRPLPLNVGDVKGKGKGKQRADVDLENQDHSGRHSDGRDDEELAGMSFSIRFTDGTNEDLLDVYVGPNESVRQLKARVRDASEAKLRKQDSDAYILIDTITADEPSYKQAAPDIPGPHHHGRHTLGAMDSSHLEAPKRARSRIAASDSWHRLLGDRRGC